MEFLTFITCNVSPRDDLLLRSMIRLLNGQSKRHWRPTDHGHADLCFQGAANPNDTSESALAVVAKHRVSLVSGTPGANEIALPLHVGNVLTTLNRVADALAASALNADAPQRAPTPAARAQVEFALVRWPDWSLLQQDSQFLRLATVLASRSADKQGLADRSGVSLECCQRFLTALAKEGLVRAALSEAEPPAPEVGGSPIVKLVAENAESAQASLWSRLRRRLGIGQPTPEARAA